MSCFLELVQALQRALKSLQMYTAAHPRSQEALAALAGVVRAQLADRPELQITASAGRLFLDGNPVEGGNVHVAALERQLSERHIAGFVLRREVPAEELRALLELLILKPARIEERGGAARILAALDLKGVSLTQTQYREVREGESEAPAAAAPAPEQSDAPEDPVLPLDIAEALDHWQRHLQSSLKGLTFSAEEGFLGYVPAADLVGLGPGALEAGWGPGFPTAPQMEALRQALRSLPGERQLAVLKGMSSLPLHPAGLHMGFLALAPELVAQASSDLLARGVEWQDLKETLYELVGVSPHRQTLLAGLEAAFRGRDGRFGELLQQVDWDRQTTDEKLRRVQDEGRLWDLSLEQRLAFLRTLLEEGRTEPFLRLLETILEALTREDLRGREGAAQTAAALCHWIGGPGFPLEAEGPLLDALKGHFGWEPVPHIHRSSEEGLGVFLQAFLDRGEIPQVQGLVEELQGLLAFLGDAHPWRSQAMERMVERLASREGVARALEAFHRAVPETARETFHPYFELLGEVGARNLFHLLGEEPDRKRRGRLMEAIRTLGAPALGGLLESLRSPTWYLVRNALNLLAEMGTAESLEEVALCLKHEDGRVRRAAVRALWKLGGADRLGDLLALLPVTDPETQVEILFGLGQVRSGAAVHVVADFARDPQIPERLRIKAVETLGLIGRASAVAPLGELLRRKGRIFSSAESAELRQAAARALAAIGSPDALETLRKAAEDEPRGQDRDTLQRILDGIRGTS